MPRTAEPTCRTYPIPPVHPLALTGHRERLCLTLLLAAFFFCLLLLPQTVRGANWYKIHTIADSQTSNLEGLSPFLLTGHPFYASATKDIPINAHGQVAFFTTVYDGEILTSLPPQGEPIPGFTETIYRGQVGSLEKIADSSMSLLSGNGFGPGVAINDLGDVAMTVGDGSHSHHSVQLIMKEFHSNGIVRYRQSTQGFTTIATADNLGVSGGLSMDNDGGVAFNAYGLIGGWERQGIAYGDGGDLSYLDAAVNNQIFEAPMLAPNSASPGPECVWGTYAGSYHEIRKGQNTPIAFAPSPSFDSVGHYSINNMGDVSFIATATGGLDGVYYGNGGLPTLVADTSGEYSYFWATAISNAGMAFKADRDLGMGNGIFTGPHALNDKVLAVGDILPGNPSPVQDIVLGNESMNDQGQIALYVLFENGEGRIIRADPFTLQSVYETGMAMAAMKTEGDASMSQMVEFAPGNESLAFDFAFPAETGNLVVLLGGQVLVELDALDGVADGLTRFETEVDLAALFPDGTAEALLEFQLYSNDATAGLYLDNIDFASLANGDFASGDLSAWQSSFIEGDGVGVAVSPYGPSPAVPEPATLLLVLFGLALLPRRRRR